MPVYWITTAITAYETYEVPAPSEAQARRQIMDPRRRGRIVAGEVRGATNNPDAGYGDDLEIIEVRERQERPC